jgi:hypothetical protein
VPADTVAAMSNAAHWAVSAGNKFREVARTTENPTTKLLAEGADASQRGGQRTASGARASRESDPAVITAVWQGKGFAALLRD